MIKDKGIVIKTYATGEYDKNIVLLLKDNGKVTVFAKGAGRPKSKLFAAAQPFVYCEFILFSGQGFLSLTQAAVIRSYFAVTADYDRFCSANSCLALAGKMLLPAMPAASALLLLLKTLGALAAGRMDQRLVRAVFEIKLMQTEGYAPMVDECIHCGEVFEPFAADLFFEAHGTVCRHCAGKDRRALPLLPQTAALARHILQTDAKDLFKLTVRDAAVIENLAAAAALLIKENDD